MVLLRFFLNENGNNSFDSYNINNLVVGVLSLEFIVFIQVGKFNIDLEIEFEVSKVLKIQISFFK